MRAAVFNGPGKMVTIERLDDPVPGPDDVVVKVGRCGICGSDVSMTSPSPFALPAGSGLGHEYAGEVVAVGREVRTIRVGDRVACMPAVGCGECAVCHSNGNVFYCHRQRSNSISLGFADYAVVPVKGAIRLPQTLSFADGALVEPTACGLHACRLADIRGGERILVLGAGAMALAVVYWARRLGARTIVVLSRSTHRRDLLLEVGADAVHRFDSESEVLGDSLGGVPDVVAECVGKEGMLDKAIAYVRPQGTVISLGMCFHGEPIVSGRCCFKELRMLFPLGWSSMEFVETVRAFESTRVRPAMMVNEVIPLEGLPSVLEGLRTGKKSLKIHVDPWLRSPHA